ncbi:MAG: protein-(glutamine-N5) methyltransferase, release factor-specific [Cytophagales bacterium CG12_big_fil_rev_8_21_14_0_65_40_12]|nr:MAG: protein-(glutamine-N5) methyltransferase, release factor-specific [Cytophagales bacterium CG12_big_fil_rev_8_21_14_0_65_40_12]PIW06120.1 MAG: peptide chain release factor N(5)-glutamine methyltransferase [Cytophagales bacterium CG17_big_fil_post_rev_8_21_14_2_50_40_13]
MPSIQPKTLQTQLIEKLKNTYGEREASNLSHLLLDHFCSLNRMAIALDNPAEITSTQLEALEKAIEQLLAHLPIQHIIGEVEFYGCRIKTDGRALIPRPETEELVDWICQENELDAPNILDIGTGTGCIPIALKRAIPEAKVNAVDISREALALAKENAQANHVTIDFAQLDVLKDVIPFQQLDIIVSNPPYIPIQEKESMDSNVVDFEPNLALFVSDEDPLIFYRVIAEQAIQILNLGGILYFEIHENFGQMLVTLMEEIGFTNVTLKQDLQGKDRMIQAQKYYK